jgi:hypothetical protein
MFTFGRAGNTIIFCDVCDELACATFLMGLIKSLSGIESGEETQIFDDRDQNENKAKMSALRTWGLIVDDPPSLSLSPTRRERIQTSSIPMRTCVCGLS